MDKSRYDNRSDQWRKRAGAKRSRDLRWASVPRRLIFLTAAAASAFVAEMVMKHSESMQDLAAAYLSAPKQQPLIGVASIIDGDTIEVHGQRIRFNGTHYATFRTAALNGWSIVKASGWIPRSICVHVTGWAIGKPGRARGENVPTAVLPRPLRR